MALQHLSSALTYLSGLCDRGGLPFHPLSDVLSLARGPGPHQVRCAFACGGALRLRSRRPAKAVEALALRRAVLAPEASHLVELVLILEQVLVAILIFVQRGLAEASQFLLIL